MALVFGEDPNYRRDQLARLGQAGQFFVSMVLSNRQEKERKRQAELERALDTLQRYPEVVDQPEGEELAKRFPELAPIVSVAKDRRRIYRGAREAGQEYLALADQLHQRNQARQATPGQPLAGIGPLANAPALAATPSAATAPGQPAADLAFVEAARSLPPSRRQAAELWAKSQGLPFPERFEPSPFDPYEDLTQKGRGVLAAETGQLPPETSTAQRIQAGLAESSGQKLQRELQEESASRQRELAYLRDARAAAGQEIQRRKVAVQETRESRLSQEGAAEGIKPNELREELKDSLVSSSSMLAPPKGEKGEVVSVGEGKTVRKPLFRPMTDAQANLIAGAIARKSIARAKETGQDATEIAFTATAAAFDLYTDLVLWGAGPRQALNVVLGKEDLPEGFSVPLERR